MQIHGNNTRERRHGWHDEEEDPSWPSSHSHPFSVSLCFFLSFLILLALDQNETLDRACEIKSFLSLSLSFSIHSLFIFPPSFSHLLLQNARSQYATLHLHSCPILLNFPSMIRLNIRNSKFASFPFRDHDRLVCEFVKPKSITWIHHRKLFGLYGYIFGLYEQIF